MILGDTGRAHSPGHGGGKIRYLKTSSGQFQGYSIFYYILLHLYHENFVTKRRKAFIKIFLARSIAILWTEDGGGVDIGQRRGL